ncbi:hypothetical protein COOONC_28472 [Cooperia oncophora]
MSWSHGGFRHALLLGPAGSGKTSVAALLAQDLANDCCCLSVRVDCSSWKGKSTEIIERCLLTEIKLLSKRVPSLLVLDDFDFLSHSSEEELRPLSTVRVIQRK